MPRLRNELVYELIELAWHLAASSGPSRFRQASRRRAVSTAYYALFHAICHICASSLIGRERRDLEEALYRSIEHGAARKALTSRDARAISPALDQIGNDFAVLQRERHAADYRPPRAGDTLNDEALTLLAMAEESIFLLEQLDEDARLALAVLLISRPRLT